MARGWLSVQTQMRDAQGPGNPKGQGNCWISIAELEVGVTVLHNSALRQVSNLNPPFTMLAPPLAFSMMIGHGNELSMKPSRLPMHVLFAICLRLIALIFGARALCNRYVSSRAREMSQPAEAFYTVQAHVESHAYQLNTPPGVHPVFHTWLLRPAANDPLPSQVVRNPEPPTCVNSGRGR